MTQITPTHPDAVLNALLDQGGRSQRLQNLRAIHEICRKQHQAGSRDFSTAAIGKQCEATGILKGRALYNAQSSDYRALIEAWGLYAGPALPKPPKVLASHEYLLRIEDPAIRSLMQAVIVERDKLRAQLNTLKANTKVVVDRRPLGAQLVTSPGALPQAILAPASQLTDSERLALRNGVSEEFLESRGWREAEHGEIVTEKGRTVFDPGFATGIRKVLNE